MAQHKNQGKLKGKEQEIIKAYVVDKIGYDTLGEIHGVSGNSIAKMLVKHGVKLRPKKTISPADKARAIDLYTNQKMSLADIGKKIGASAAGVLKILRKTNIRTRSVGEAVRQYQLDEHFFDVVDTEEKAYFLGFLYADGCNQMEHFWSVVLSLELADQEILHKLAALVYKDPEDATAQVKIHNREAEGKDIETALYMNSKHMCEQLMKLGCVSRKTFKLVYPDWMPTDLHRHFVRGYFDGDGTINNETEMQSGCKIVSTSSFLEGVKEVCRIDCTLFKHSKDNDKDTYELYYSGNRNQLLFLHWIYSGATIYLQRKYDAYLRFCEKMRTIDEKIMAGTRGFNMSNLRKTASISNAKSGKYE